MAHAPTWHVQRIRQCATLTAAVAIMLCAGCSRPTTPNDDPPISYPLAVKEAAPLELVLLSEANGALAYQVDCIGIGNDVSVMVGAGNSQSGQIVEKKTFAPAGCAANGTIIGTGALAYPMQQEGQSFVTMTVTPNPNAALQTPSAAGRVISVTVPLAFENDEHLHSGPTIVGI